MAPLLTQYVEAEATLSGAERAAVDAHLAACPSCQEEAYASRTLGAFLRERGPAALPAPVPAPDLWDRIEGRLVTEQRDSRRAPLSLRPVLLFAPAMAAIAVALVYSMPAQKGTPVSAPMASAPMMAAETGAAAEAKERPESFKAADAPAPVFRDVAAKPKAMVAMNEAATTRPAAPSVSRTAELLPEVAGKQIGRRTSPAAAETFRFRNNAASVAITRRKESVAAPPAAAAARYSSTFALRESRGRSLPTITLADAGQSSSAPGAITIVDVAASPAAAASASARPTLSSLPDLRTVAPSADTAGRSAAVAKSAITIVSSEAGTGVTSAAYAPPPVTDTMIRQRQRRGLFGGYGTGGAAIGVLPAGAGGNGSGGMGGAGSAPW